MVMRQGVHWCLDLDEGIDFSIYLLGAFERPTAQALRRLVRPGSVVLDIGANIGAHCLPLARLVGDNGRVFAFEPTAPARAKLERNLALNPDLVARVQIEALMLLDRDRAPLPSAIEASWPVSGKIDDGGSVARAWTTVGAHVITLDRFVAEAGLERVNLIKIDVDGYEPAVLTGAAAVLRRFRPVIVIELAPDALAAQGHDLADLVALLAGAGYRLFDLREHAPLPTGERLARLIPRAGSINAVARAVA